MRVISASVGLAVLLGVSAANADEKIPVLKSGEVTYTNVTVTSVSATDVYFTHGGGMGNAKLKNLSPDLQTHFHFNPANANATEQRQIEATAQYQKTLLAAKPKDQEPDKLAPATYDTGDVVAPKIFAHSFRGQRSPAITVDRWLTAEPPNPDGKFVLVFMWIVSAEQCRNFVPHINNLAEKFKSRMITIGLSNEPLEELLKVKSPGVHFFAGTDTQSRTFMAYEVTALPHLVLIDPAGIVRFEGTPNYLDEKSLTHLLSTYAQ